MISITPHFRPICWQTCSVTQRDICAWWGFVITSSTTINFDCKLYENLYSFVLPLVMLCAQRGDVAAP